MGIQLRGRDYFVKIFLNLMCRRIKKIYIIYSLYILKPYTWLLGYQLL